MQVIFVTGEYPPQTGGVGDYTARLAATLADRNVKVAVVATNDALSRTAAATSAFAVIRCRRPWSRAARQQVDALAAAHAPSWIHVQYQTAAFRMNPGINLAPRAWRQANRYVAWTYHDLLPPYLFPRIGTQARTRITLRPALDASLVISTNRGDCRRLQAWGYRPHLIPVASNIPALACDAGTRRRTRQAWGAAEDDFLVGYFGLAQRDKGLQTLVEALRVLRQRDLAVRLLIIGGAASAADAGRRACRASVQRLIRTAGLESRVTWTGSLPAADVSRALSSCDAMALPYADGASARHGALAACLAHGCATVTTAPQQTDLLAPGVPVIPRLSFLDLADRLDALAHSAEARARARQAARASCAPRSWDAVADQHLALYETTVRRAKALA